MGLTITPAGEMAVIYNVMTPTFYATAGKYVQLIPNVHAWQFRTVTQGSPLVEGRSIKRAGKDTRTVDRILVWYVGADAAAVEALLQADCAAMKNKACELDMSEQPDTLGAAECMDFFKVPNARGRLFHLDPGSNLVRVCVQISFEQLRDE